MASLARLARVVGAAGTACTALPLAAQLASQRAVPSTYAITNARLVPVSGPVVEKGTIVVRTRSIRLTSVVHVLFDFSGLGGKLYL